MDVHAYYRFGLWFIFIYAAVVFPLLFFVTAPYGRHNRGGWGPQMNARWAWVVMEAPSPIAFTVVFLMGTHAWSTAPLVLAGLYLLHYIYRAFIFPFRMRGEDKKTKPLLTVVMAIVFNVFNGSLNALAIAWFGDHLVSGWTGDPRFALGVALFFVGWAVNHQSDAILRGLRAPGETGYKIPRGGLYRWVTSPNYFGEIVEWSGFALAAWTMPALAFAIFTAANLVPRAVSHHKWYHEKFPNYPPERRAVIPGLL